VQTVGKLVRDRIPELIAASGRTPHVRVLDEHEFNAALLEKLVEEVTELREADPMDRLEEAADICEVLWALLAAQGFTGGDLAVAAHDKRQRRGGFTQRLWLETDD
jgi:predicted house-cleaning noncanonical NTP pyrophosphatase (MazG superfamily)